MDSPKIVLLVGLVLVLYVLFMFLSSERVEAFTGTVPAATQTSMIPTNSSGATTSNPTQSKPQATDLLALQSTLNDFRQLYDTFNPSSSNLTNAVKRQLASYRERFNTINNQIQMGLANSDASTLTVSNASTIRNDLNILIGKMRNSVQQSQQAQASAANASASQAATMAAQAAPQVAAGTPGKITLEDLKQLKIKIKREILRLSNLRSSSPTVYATISQLDKLQGDLTDLISKVERKVMSIDEVSITKESAEAFLRDMQAKKYPLPSLIAPTGTTAAARTTTRSSSTTNQAELALVEISRQLQNLMEAAEVMKWDVQFDLSYDPDAYQRSKIMKRVDALEAYIKSLIIADKPVSKDMLNLLMKEMEVLQIALLPKGTQVSMNEATIALVSPGSRSAYQSRAPQEQFSAAEYPSAERMGAAQGAGMGPRSGTFPNGETSPDVYVRPGYPMTDDMIRHRASSSVFNEASVGGYDFKGRVQELCKQIKEAKLGEPSDFGCIKNPTEVSSDYSWRGNYHMVCNRLGDTWGGWYPEMFGCPKYDPTNKFRGTML